MIVLITKIGTIPGFITQEEAIGYALNIGLSYADFIVFGQNPETSRFELVYSR